MTFFASLRKELLELWRCYRFLVTAVVLLVFGLGSPLLAKFIPQLIKMMPGAESFAALIPQPTFADAISQYVKNISQFGIVLALLMTMGSVVQEKEKGTASMVLAKPLPRSFFLLAKFAALCLNFFISLALASLGGFYYTMVLFHAPHFSAWLALNILIFLSLAVYVSMTLFFSTLFRSQWAAAGLGLSIIISLSALSSFPGLGKYLPSSLLSWGASLVRGDEASAWPALVISLALILISLLASWLVFKRQEL